MALNLIPVLAGGVRLFSLASSAAITAANARFFAQPLPVVLHITCGVVYCLLGILQFQSGFRRRNRRWHRVAGWIVAPAGIVAALAGLWMTLFYPHVPNDGPVLYLSRLAFGALMVLCIALGIAAILRRDIVHHRAWMMRGYALGLGAGTQALIQIPWVILVGEPTELPRSLLMGGAWLLNLAVAEWVIRQSPQLPRNLAPAM
ncbi:MAG: DUF2306 domain-containing protein [bacterium]